MIYANEKPKQCFRHRNISDNANINARNDCRSCAAHEAQGVGKWIKLKRKIVSVILSIGNISDKDIDLIKFPGCAKLWGINSVNLSIFKTLSSETWIYKAQSIWKWRSRLQFIKIRNEKYVNRLSLVDWWMIIFNKSINEKCVTRWQTN